LGATTPDHLREELLGIVPLLVVAQALEQGAIGVRVGGERHVSDEAPGVVEAALAVVTRNEGVIGDDIGGAGRGKGGQHTLGVGETTPARQYPATRVFRATASAVPSRSEARCAKLLDEEGIGNSGGSLGLPHGLHKEERGVQVAEVDEVVQPLVSPAPARAAPGRGCPRVDPPGGSCRGGGEADAGAVRFVVRGREGVGRDGSGGRPERGGGAGGENRASHFHGPRAFTTALRTGVDDRMRTRLFDSDEARDWIRPCLGHVFFFFLFLHFPMKLN